jgi:hypothetical protein
MQQTKVKYPRPQAGTRFLLRDKAGAEERPKRYKRIRKAIEVLVGKSGMRFAKFA